MFGLNYFLEISNPLLLNRKHLSTEDTPFNKMIFFENIMASVNTA
jgi:hypothetical protein